MPNSVLDAAGERLRNSHGAHFHTVRDYLTGREVVPSKLWLSVGYFIHGTGAHATIKPWKTTEQLDQLLEDTGRK